MQTNLDCHPTQKKHTGCTGILRTEWCQKQEHILDPRAKEAWRDSDLKSTKQTEQSGGEPPTVKKQLNLILPSNIEHNRLTVCVSSRQTVVALFLKKKINREQKNVTAAERLIQTWQTKLKLHILFSFFHPRMKKTMSFQNQPNLRNNQMSTS